MPVITFYLPYQDDGISSIPLSVDEYWDWVCSNSRTGEGKYSWTLQTYIQFRQAGIACSLKQELPRKGIVISHRDFIPVYKMPYPDLFLVCIKPDRKEHPWAHYYIVQNESDPICSKFKNRTSVSLSWPQPGLIPREKHKGTRVINIAYFGRIENTPPELKSPDWKEELLAIGFNWRVVPMDLWHDYRDIDVTVSIRAWGASQGKSNSVTDWNSKPPSKLTNSWLAGVPAVVGDEPAYKSICQTGKNCIIVNSLDNLKKALINLRNNPNQYKRLQEQGAISGEEFSTAAIRRHWEKLVKNDILCAYEDWMRLSRLKRQSINIYRTIGYFTKPRNIIDPLAGIINSRP